MSTPTDQVLAAAHRKTTQASPSDIATFLSETLGTSLTAHMCDVDPKTLRRWARGTAKPGQVKELRLRAAYQTFQLLQSRDSQHTVRAWFLGMNPQLDDMSPVEAIREERLRDVNVAARAFILGG